MLYPEYGYIYIYIFRNVYPNYGDNIQKANAQMKEKGRTKQMVSFTEVYKKLKRKSAYKIINKPTSPTHKITSNGNKLRKWIHAGRRVRKPRMSWAEKTVKQIWNYLKKDIERFRYTAFDEENEEMMATIKQPAQTNT
jgi:hypothetical protein